MEREASFKLKDQDFYKVNADHRGIYKTWYTADRLSKLCQAEYHLSSQLHGLEIHCHGYNDKMSVLLERVLMSMKELRVLDDRFPVIKERLVRGYKNWSFIEPYLQVDHCMAWLVEEEPWIVEQYLVELENITAADIRHFYSQLHRQLHIEVLSHGNVSKKDAL
jgi:insulysin